VSVGHLLDRHQGRHGNAVFLNHRGLAPSGPFQQFGQAPPGRF